MRICNTYEEAKLTAIHIIAYFDNYPKQIDIFPYGDKWAVDYEEYDDETRYELNL